MSSEPRATNDDSAAGPSTSKNESQEPIKGILKRPSIKVETKDQIVPTITHRPSPDRFPDKPGTRIPKLSVTWWEKNAVAIFGDTSDENNTDSEQLFKDLGNGASAGQPDERQTAILDSEDDSEEVLLESQDLFDDEPREETMSVASSTGSASSSVVGRWWTGKDTRYVPHCHKRGCNHNHSDLGEYLTPTQRRNREVSELKNELKAALKERDEKERHLEELRERIKEVEVLNVKQASLSDSHRLMMREREAAEAHEREKKQMERRHAVRVNQLVQETLTARDENIRLNSRVKELENLLNVPRTDSETMTDTVQYALPASQSPITFDPVDPNQTVRSPPPATSPAMPLSPVHSLPDQMTMSSPVLTSPHGMSAESKVTGPPMYLSQEALNHIQACQNEAFIWRTKAAQLEIVVKDQLAKANRIEEALRAELLAARSGQPQAPDVAIKSTATGEDLTTGTPTRVSPVSLECTLPSCVERKKDLIQENNRLLEQIEEVNMRIHELEDDVTALRHDLDGVEDHRDRLKQQLEVTVQERDSKIAEIAACNIVIARHQSEKETMQKAIAYMEERMQVYQNTLMSHDIVVSDESSSDWRKGFVDPRYNIMMSKRVQTTLTAEALSRHESEFATTKRKLTELHSEFASNRSDLHERFAEIEKILLTKTQLVDTLSKQLEDSRRDQRQQIDSHQEERESYKKKLEEISAVAEKVPVLETRIEQLLKEKSEFELRFSAQREEMERALEEALSEALAKYKEQSDYWMGKQAALEQSLERAKAEIAQHLKEKEDMKIKAKLDRADLERRLTSSIDHVAMLNSQINKSRRDVECEARPRHVSKYVACRPNSRSKSTTIPKGDLFDENEERLKLCQGELSTTRRQVHVLQQKLISTMQEKADKRVQVRRRIACVVDREPEPPKADLEKLEALQTKNAELREQVTSELHLTTAEEEKATLVRSERERIRHLVNEFENVRRELDQEMSRYESEKTWLKSRIRNLETDNEELQRTIEAQAEGASTSKDPAPMRKTLSEPDIGTDDEAGRLRTENIRLKRELDRVRESLRKTAFVVGRDRSQLSPAFATLADDLNLVKSDLEQILNTMDSGVPSSKDKLPDQSLSPTPGKSPVDDEELLHSNILETVMMSWEADERENLSRDLMRSRQERAAMKTRIERLTRQLNEAQAELQVYRREGVTARSRSPHENPQIVIRSRSASNLIADVTDKHEVQIWKEKCGTMFRELNAMRAGYQRAQEDRRELKIQVAMLRGELELARCQSERDAETSMDSSVYFSPISARSRSYHTPSELRREYRNNVIVHENPRPFDRTSTRATVACHISVPPPQKPRIVEDERRARSEQRKRTTSTRMDYEARERRRSARKNIPSSLSSSITSVLEGQWFENAPQQQMRSTPLMSQSWHETGEHRADFGSQRAVSHAHVNRRESRAISLRERVGQLLRENRSLQDQLALSNAALTSARKSRIDNERLNRLEQEKDALRAKVELLLAKIDQDTTSACTALAEANARLELSRNENMMYEKKIRDMEEERREMYLVMFKKGQEAAAMDLKEVAQVDQMTQDRVVLRFLHDAFYYYLMNKGDAKEHLQAIMTMLDFSVEQKDEVAKRKGRSH
ncbi:hypothetical protein Y032_0032g2447 [Ancylostoma ceylanicum]|uniref:GRIP domain-containing protein n=1 Tax=Ancylostoma ceylanicum TaxID=53326 RepID=A0A016UNF0_9BILA|nr:hypothetical protein Y032_0032g2447 [Ancylostoma ceylanicum]